jgi:exopolysaccharide/PEP-CTERM locus tyrosine autokinase
MSLVERALKKLQEARAAQPAAPASAPVPRAHTAGDVTAPRAEPKPRSRRTIKIDRESLRANELLPAAAEERRLQQEYRQIKRPLIGNATGRGAPDMVNAHTILVASALPGDGKTFTSINLALSMALEKDIRVLLVDADVAKRHISKILDVADEPGLLDVLRDETVDIESTIISTDVPGLSVLPAGRPSDTATELLASARMRQVVEQLEASDPNLIVLLDSPPLLLTSESRALAAAVGQVVLVVRAGVTPQQAVIEAAALVGEGRPIGLVLNQGEDSGNRSYYHAYGDEELQQKAP